MTKFGRVQSIERAVMILNCFSEKNSELKLTEIADYLGLNKSTIHGIINTMKDARLIDQNEENQKYRLGLKLVELGSLVLKNLDIRQVAKPILTRLCEEVNETVHLGILDGDEIVYIDKVESTQSIRIFTSIGTRYNAFCTAIGKTILAFKPLDEIEKIFPKEFPKYTKNTKNSFEEIVEELDTVKKMGYSLDIEENIEGLKCVGVPIYNHENKVKYSISVSGPTTRMNDEKTNLVIEKAKEAAIDISRKIGYLEK